MRFKRITIEPGKMGGAPCIRGMRMPVASIVRMIGEGWSTEDIRRDWPELEPEDISEALQYAAEAASGRHMSLQ